MGHLVSDLLGGTIKLGKCARPTSALTALSGEGGEEVTQVDGNGLLLQAEGCDQLAHPPGDGGVVGLTPPSLPASLLSDLQEYLDYPLLN